MKKNKKIIIGILITILIMVIGIVVAFKLIEGDVTNRENFNTNVENISSEPVNTESHDKQKFNYLITIYKVD